MGWSAKYVSQGARFSEDRVYRWTLWRTWREEASGVLWVMLNPSTADEVSLDPTIRRCEDFSREWGFGGLVVCNLFGLRSTDPNALAFAVRQQRDPVGAENDAVILDQCDRAHLIVAAWGLHGKLMGRGQVVMQQLIERYPSKVRHLGVNSDGSPKHPLYLPKGTELRHWGQDDGGMPWVI